MKKLIGFVTLWLVVAAAPVFSASYLGDFCWERDGGGLVRLGLTHMGGGHLQLNGWADTSGPGQLTVVVGAGEIANDKLTLTLHFSGETEAIVWAGTGRAVLDAVTLDGTIELLEISHLRSDPDPTSAMTSLQPLLPFSPVPCP